MNSIAVTADNVSDRETVETQGGLDIHDHSDVSEYETIGEPFVDDPKMSARNVNVYLSLIHI